LTIVIDDGATDRTSTVRRGVPPSKGSAARARRCGCVSRGSIVVGVDGTLRIIRSAREEKPRDERRDLARDHRAPTSRPTAVRAPAPVVVVRRPSARLPHDDVMSSR
jgi:hypothetical protein